MDGDRFLLNKYHRWYDALMQKARVRERLDGHFEKHHIIPQCIGGTNESKNIACLTFREHFLAHWLLTKFTTGDVQRKMFFALKMMGHKNNQEKGMTSWQYAIAKMATKKPFTEEHRNKISASNKGRRFTEEHKKKIGDANRGKECTPEMRGAVAAANRRREHTEDANKRRSIASKKFMQTEKGKAFIATVLLTIPRCPVTGRMLPKPK